VAGRAWQGRRPGSRRLRRGVLPLLLALLGLGAAWLSDLLPWPAGADLSGPAAVVDGDTLQVEGERVRLMGVDAPESRQSCERDRATWPCGAEATAALRRFLQGREVRCTLEEERDRYGRALGRCRAGEEDIGAWLVRRGLAVAYTDYSYRYLPQELLARWEGQGLWAGSFERPAEWRRRNRN
jgi:endonuclease YncB( thermonuclease family)